MKIYPLIDPKKIHLTKRWALTITAQKMKFSIKDFFSKFDQIRFLAHLVTFIEEILKENFIFCAVYNDHISFSIICKLCPKSAKLRNHTTALLKPNN